MLYRLLRNNKESGPFTTLQLKEMGLKPYDLLWTEGRGAAWQYASEITELKEFAPVVEEKPFERSYTQKEVLQTASQPAVAVKKVKPRYRISNGQLIMIEAGSMEIGTNGVIKETLPPIKETTPVRHINTLPVETKPAEAPDWQSAYPQWQPQQQPKEEIKTEEPVEIETKYSESLDNLKKRYAEKVLGEKKEPLSSSVSSASVKQNIMAIVALIVLVAGGYIGYTLKNKDAASVSNGQPSVERADIAGNNPIDGQPVVDNSSSNDNTVAENKSNNTQAGTKDNDSKSATGVNATVPATGKTILGSAGKETNKAGVTDPQKKSAEIVTNANASKAVNKPVVTDGKTTVKANTAAQQTSTGAPVKSNGTTSALPVPAPPVVKSVNKQIGDYVSVKKLGGSGAGVQNVKLMVSNVSDFPIDLAVVDIQYFDSKGKFQKGETMYVKDINGGNNVEVRVPDSDKSSSIKYKVSMVQADQKTLYLVAD